MNTLNIKSMLTDIWEDVEEYIARYIYTGLQDGSIMKGWMKEENAMITCCSDGTRMIWRMKFMRRKDREITEKSRINEILEKGLVIHLGLQDGEYPYVIPLHYGFEYADEKLVFYMHGAKEGHKIELLKNNSKAGFEIECEVEQVPGGEVPCMYGSYYASVMGKGNACIVEDDSEKIHGLEVLMKTQTKREFVINREMAESVCIIKLECVSFSAKSREKRT